MTGGGTGPGDRRPAEAPLRALVLGGYGAVGAGVVSGLRARGDTAFAVGRDPARADRVVDLRAPSYDAYLAALDGIDVVVNAAGLEDPGLVAVTTGAGVAFVDATATTDYVLALEHLAPRAPVLLSVGLAPGLTSLLAASAHSAAPGQTVDIALVLGAGERHGAAAVEWSYGLLGRRFPDTHGGPPVLNYSRPRVFRLPGLGRRRLYRADFSDHHTLSRGLGSPVRTYFGLDSRAATAALALLTRVPGGSRAPRGLHLPGGDRWLALAESRGGVVRWARGRSQSRATALVSVLAAGAASSLGPGVHHLQDVLDLSAVPRDQGIRFGGRNG